MLKAWDPQNEEEGGQDETRETGRGRERRRRGGREEIQR